MKDALWLMSFKVRVFRSSPLAMDDSEYAEAEAATFATSKEDAEAQLLQQLDQAKLELVKCNHLTDIDEASWVSLSGNRDDILELVAEVKCTGQFGFGVFRVPEGVGK